MTHSLKVVPLVKGKQLHALDQVGASYAGIEYSEMSGAPFGQSREHVFHSAGFQFELVLEFVQGGQPAVAEVQNRISNGPVSIAWAVL